MEEDLKHLLSQLYETEVKFLEEELILRKTMAGRLMEAYIEVFRKNEPEIEQIRKTIKAYEQDELILSILDMSEKYGPTSISKLTQKIQVLMANRLGNRNDKIQNIADSFVFEKQKLIKEFNSSRDRINKKIRECGVEPANFITLSSLR